MVEGDRRRRIRPLRGLLAVALLAALGAVAPGTAGAAEAELTAESTCGAAILRDWRADGAVGEKYEAECYYDAIDALPEDVRTYTSAEDDITRALQVHVDEATSGGEARELSAAAAPTPAPSAAGTLRVPPLPVLVLAALGALLVAGALVVALPALVRRR